MNGEAHSFAIWCEAEGYDRPLLMHNLTFARLIDEIIVPFDGEQPFFVDGAPLTKKKIRTLKILKQGEDFDSELNVLHWEIRAGGLEKSKLYADQYRIRLEAITRETCEDVTSQVIKAFNTEIRPKLKDYIPKREELIQGALTVFVQALKSFGGTK